ncbi:MAG: AAA family ATPase [Chloroflexota bacterium]|nr:AAA family ATPase [Chloroflexota bacterium]
MKVHDDVITVLLLESDAAVLERARAALTNDPLVQLSGVANDERSFLAKVSTVHPDAAIVDISAITTDFSAVLRDVLSRDPDCCVIAVAGADKAGAMSRAVSAGARGFLMKPYQPHQLLETIHEVVENARAIRQLQQGEAAGEGRRGSVIAVYSPKGGVGGTAVATNLAVALAGRSKSTAALVDLDLQFGDVGVALDVKSANSILELAAGDATDPATIEDVFVKHRSGLRVLLAPEDLAAVESIDTARIVGVIDDLRDHFQFVVCDLWASLDELSMAVLSAADRVVMVTTPELPALRDVRRALDAMAARGLDGRTVLVVNRFPTKAGVTKPEIEHGLGRPVVASIPSDGIAVTGAMNEGRSLFESLPRFRKLFEQLAESVVGELTPAKAPNAPAGRGAVSARREVA